MEQYRMHLSTMFLGFLSRSLEEAQVPFKRFARFYNNLGITL